MDSGMGTKMRLFQVSPTQPVLFGHLRTTQHFAAGTRTVKTYAIHKMTFTRPAHGIDRKKVICPTCRRPVTVSVVGVPQLRLRQSVVVGIGLLFLAVFVIALVVAISVIASGGGASWSYAGVVFGGLAALVTLTFGLKMLGVTLESERNLQLRRGHRIS
jgi:hypothetical protein